MCGTVLEENLEDVGKSFIYYRMSALSLPSISVRWNIGIVLTTYVCLTLLARSYINAPTQPPGYDHGYDSTASLLRPLPYIAYHSPVPRNTFPSFVNII